MFLAEMFVEWCVKWFLDLYKRGLGYHSFIYNNAPVSRRPASRYYQVCEEVQAVFCSETAGMLL